MATPTPAENPEDDDFAAEEICPEEMAAILEGIEQIKRGEAVPWEQVWADLIEEELSPEAGA